MLFGVRYWTQGASLSTNRDLNAMTNVTSSNQNRATGLMSSVYSICKIRWVKKLLLISVLMMAGGALGSGALVLASTLDHLDGLNVLILKAALVCFSCALALVTAVGVLGVAVSRGVDE